MDVNESPALFSIVDPNNMIKLALFRDMGTNNIITIHVNNCGFQTDTIAAHAENQKTVISKTKNTE